MSTILRVSLAAIFTVAASHGADVLQLRGGRTFTGQFVGATRTQVWFQPESKADISETMVFPVGQVASIAFDSDAKPLGPSGQLRTPVREQEALTHPLEPDFIRGWIAALGLRQVQGLVHAPRLNILH